MTKGVQCYDDTRGVTGSTTRGSGVEIGSCRRHPWRGGSFVRGGPGGVASCLACAVKGCLEGEVVGGGGGGGEAWEEAAEQFRRTWTAGRNASLELRILRETLRKTASFARKSLEAAAADLRRTVAATCEELRAEMTASTQAGLAELGRAAGLAGRVEGVGFLLAAGLPDSAASSDELREAAEAVGRFSAGLATSTRVVATDFRADHEAIRRALREALRIDTVPLEPSRLDPLREALSAAQKALFAMLNPSTPVQPPRFVWRPAAGAGSANSSPSRSKQAPPLVKHPVRLNSQGLLCEPGPMGVVSEDSAEQYELSSKDLEDQPGFPASSRPSLNQKIQNQKKTGRNFEIRQEDFNEIFDPLQNSIDSKHNLCSARKSKSETSLYTPLSQLKNFELPRSENPENLENLLQMLANSSAEQNPPLDFASELRKRERRELTTPSPDIPHKIVIKKTSLSSLPVSPNDSLSFQRFVQSDPPDSKPVSERIAQSRKQSESNQHISDFNYQN